MRFLFLFLMLLPVSGLFAQKNQLDMRSLAPGCWVHTTYGKFKGSYFPSNGLIVEQGDRVWIVDTGWGIQSTRKLLKWIKKNLHKPVALVIITHAHDDRAGGISVFQKQHIPVYMTAQTAELLQKQHYSTTPYQVLAGKNGIISSDDFNCQWLFPGAGHAPDNIVVYFPQKQVLFGGCFVKSTEAQNLGNVADANVVQWPASIHLVQSAYPDARLVVPGHQAWGGPELLEHTLKLLENTPK